MLLDLVQGVIHVHRVDDLAVEVVRGSLRDYQLPPPPDGGDRDAGSRVREGARSRVGGGSQQIQGVYARALRELAPALKGERAEQDRKPMSPGDNPNA